MTARPRAARIKIGKARLAEMIEAATVDCYNESELTTGWLTMIEDNLAVPFETEVFGVQVTVERIDLSPSEQIVAMCRRGKERQALPILDLPLPAPSPGGAEWIDVVPPAPSRSCRGAALSYQLGTAPSLHRT